MVRRTRHSSFGVNPESGPERPDERPGYRRNATTMSKVSRRGNTSAREHVRDSSVSQFAGQVNSHGLHLHVRVTAHPNNQLSPKPGDAAIHSQYTPGQGHLGKHNKYQGPNVQFQGTNLQLHGNGQYQPSPKYRDLPPDGRHASNRANRGQAVEGETGPVTSTPQDNVREARPQQKRTLQEAAHLPPIEGGVTGMSTFRGPADFPPLDIPYRQASFGTPTLRSPIAKPPTDRHNRALIRDKTVSTMDIVRFPECSPVASGVYRKSKKNSLAREQKERVPNGKFAENGQNMQLSITDLSKKLHIGQSAEIHDRFERQTLERSHENLDEEWKRYSSLGSHISHEPFSIRRKIEQFKKWHEEQNREKTLRVEHAGTESVNTQENATAALDSDPTTSQSPKDAHPPEEHKQGTKLPEVNQKQECKVRPKSAKTYVTWKTWRDVNESYAYSDAKKYIEENELMTGEKEDWIQKWIDGVDREFFCGGRRDLDSSYSGESIGGATV